jgi:endonuclease VIII
MPEGDVVWRAAQQLHAATAGRILTRSDFRVPRFATTDLAGLAVTETVSRGKHLLTRVTGGHTIHTHLKMDGSWRIRPAGGYPPRDHRVRLVLANDAWQAIGSLLGVVEILPTDQEQRAVGHLGPDLLGPDWDPAEAVRRLRADPGRPVGAALLDQRNLAGVGNLYKCEVLFLRGIEPWRPVGDIDDLASLVELAQRLLDANKERVGQVTTGMPGRGEQTWVYGRSGQPCRRCGGRIQAVGQAEHGGYGGYGGRAQATRRAGPASQVPTTGRAGPASQVPATRWAGTGARTGDTDDRVTFWCPGCQPAAQ